MLVCFDASGSITPEIVTHRQPEGRGLGLDETDASTGHIGDHKEYRDPRYDDKNEIVLAQLQHQVDALSSLLVQAEDDKDELTRQLQEQRALHESATDGEIAQQATLLAEMEQRVRWNCKRL